LIRAAVEYGLEKAGHEKVFHLEGGLAAWRAAGLPD
jgi:3-mercaptopyruvate sulfurtransferase SseA